MVLDAEHDEVISTDGVTQAVSATVEIILVLVAVAVSCALPGAFLVLRRMSLVSDAISHVMLFGIVLAFLVTGNLDSPWLMFGAAATGVLTVALVEALQRTRLVKEDAAIGLVFPALFAMGALFVSMYSRNIHLDLDSVLLGQPAFAYKARWTIGQTEIRPIHILTVLAMLNTGLIVVFYKELKLATFDAALAASLGFLPGAIHYGLMTLVSLTAVACFDAAGAVLVVAFFIVPAAAAYLLTDRLSVMLALSAVIGAIGAVAGTWISLELDTNIPGAVAVVLGLLFALVFVFAPGRGMISRTLQRVRQRKRFHETMLAIHLLQHEGTPHEVDEARIDSLHRLLEWDAKRVRRVIERACSRDLMKQEGGLLKLTARGREAARSVLSL